MLYHLTVFGNLCQDDTFCNSCTKMQLPRILFRCGPVPKRFERPARASHALVHARYRYTLFAAPSEKVTPLPGLRLGLRKSAQTIVPPCTSSKYLILRFGISLTQLELNTPQAPKPRHRGLRSSARARDLAAVYLGQIPRPVGPFAIYDSRQPGATLVLPEPEFQGSGDPKFPAVVRGDGP